jgi:hypothetical protein
MTMRSSSLAVAVAATLWALGGCALLPDRRIEQLQVDELLAQYQRVSTASLELQRKEFAEAAAANERTSDDGTRLRLAMILLIPDAPWRDDARVGQLLGSIDAAKSNNASPRRNFVAFLEGMLQLRRDERRKCEQRVDAIREDRRKVEMNLVNAREECKRADALQQKLDELRDIDRDLRSKRPSRRSKP